MTNVNRICPGCGEQSPLDAHHCPHCGYDNESGLPAPQRNLSATIGKAALPVLAGVAGLAVRAAWKLLQSRLTQDAIYKAATSVAKRNAQAPIQPAAPEKPIPVSASRPKRTIRIRSSWAVGDANGAWRQGSSEHTIEFDD